MSEDPDATSLHPPIAAPLGEVETERLRLSRLREADLDALARVFAKPEVWEYPLGRGMTAAETEGFLGRQVERWAASGFGLWLATERESGRAMGFVGLTVPTFLPEILPAVEVGWRLDPEFWGRGYATEGAAAALDEAFGTLGLATVCTLPQTANRRSMKVAERLEMTPAPAVDLAATETRGSVEVTPFWLTAEEWRARR